MDHFSSVNFSLRYETPKSALYGRMFALVTLPVIGKLEKSGDRRETDKRKKKQKKHEDLSNDSK